MLMLDICCGLKGASEPFRAMGWKVITLDIDPKFNPDIVADVRTWQYVGERPDLIWCSPPCTEFAREFMPWCKTGKRPDLSIVEACERIIVQAEPRYWVLENVKGALEWITPILGNPRYVCNPYYLWGYFPEISHIRVQSKKEKLSSTKEAERAVIPPALSGGLAWAIEHQVNVFDM